MLKLTEYLLEAGLQDQVITGHELVRLLGGTQQSRHSMVNKAIVKGDIVRVMRGVYVLSDKYRRTKLSKFNLASRIQPCSYITSVSALSYHGWIPERVVVIISAFNKERRLRYKTPYGEFDYINVATKPYEFLTGVFRLTVADKPFLLASPLRALADMVYIKKLENVNFEYLVESMRIEEENLRTIDIKEVEKLLNVYRAIRVISFLKNIKKEV